MKSEFAAFLLALAAELAVVLLTFLFLLTASRAAEFQQHRFTAETETMLRQPDFQPRCAPPKLPPGVQAPAAAPRASNRPA